VWEREAIQQGVPLEKVEESTLEEMAKEFSLKSVNDMFQEIGFGNISARQVIGRLRQRLGIKEQEKELPLSVERAPKEPSQRGIKVKGVEGILIRFPNCCKPLPGEKVVGFLTKGRGISIHRRTCKNVLKNSNGRLLEIEWEPSGEQYYPARIKIIGLDRKGLLADITGLLSKKNANILSLDVKTTKDKKGTGLLTIEVRDINHLQEILTSLRALKDVLKVQRF
jgi:GTP pyrophosphokinase